MTEDQETILVMTAALVTMSDRIRRLRNALEQIAEGRDVGHAMRGPRMREIAQAALDADAGQ